VTPPSRLPDHDARIPDGPARVALLECDHVPDPLRHLGDDYGTMFIDRFADHAPWVSFERFDVIGGQDLPTVGSHDGYLITGSRYSVTDDLPWLAGLRKLTTDLVAADLPVVGICFGHQLLADELGGRVERATNGWGVGIHTATVTARRPWMDPSLDEFRLIVSHQDQVVELPPEAALLAESAHAPIAAFEVGSAIGFQGHPEFDPSYSAALMDMRRDRIPAAVIDVGEASLTQVPDHGAVVAWLGNHLRAARTLPDRGPTVASSVTAGS
jgi:GMP synthase-like glutamine amidotransferase